MSAMVVFWGGQECGVKTIQYNKSIYNVRTVSRRAESEAQAVTMGEDGEARV